MEDLGVWMPFDKKVTECQDEMVVRVRRVEDICCEMRERQWVSTWCLASMLISRLFIHSSRELLGY